MKKIKINFDPNGNKLAAQLVDDNYLLDIPSDKMELLIKSLCELSIQKIIVDGSLSTIQYEDGEVFFQNFSQYYQYVEQDKSAPKEFLTFIKQISEFAKESQRQNMELARAIAGDAEEKEKEEKSTELDRIRKELEEATRRYTELDEECDKKVDAKKEAEEGLAKAKKKKEEIEAEIRELEEKKAGIDLQGEDALVRREGIEREIAALTRENDTLTAEIEGATKGLAALQKQIAEAQADLEKIKKDVVDIKLQKVRLEQLETEIKGRLAGYEKDEEAAKARLAGLKAATATAQKSNQEESERIAELAAKETAIRGRLAGYEDAEKAAKARLEGIKSEIDERKFAEISANVGQIVNPTMTPSVPKGREPQKKRRISRIAAVTGKIIGGVLFVGMMLHAAYYAFTMVQDNFDNVLKPKEYPVVGSTQVETYKPYEAPENSDRIEYTYTMEVDTSIYDECRNAYHLLFEKYAHRYGIDERIIAAIATTSGGIHSENMTEDGYIGLMSLPYYEVVNTSVVAFNYETREYELKTITQENVSDLESSIEFACMRFQTFRRKYNGNVSLALTACCYGEDYVNNILTQKAEEEGISVETVIKELTEADIARLFADENGVVFAYEVLGQIPAGSVLEFKTVNNQKEIGSEFFLFENSYDREYSYTR